MDQDLIKQAAEVIADADALLIGAGAGMGVDSGLPDFRGDKGFWKAYPPLERLGISFVSMANPKWFKNDPSLAWGFYGHRLHLYRDTTPHNGFSLLKKWSDEKPSGGFVYTSNVDGHFQKAGFAESQVVECHGSLNHLQCSLTCGDGIWSAVGTEVNVDLESFRAAAPFPSCPNCQRLARPNVLMFGDWHWVEERTNRQYAHYQNWRAGLRHKKLVIIECGAGTAVPSVRANSERALDLGEATLIRINPRESHGRRGTISLPYGALSALEAIENEL